MEWPRTLFAESQQVPLYAVSFDESCNNLLKQGQINLHVRYWNSEKESGCPLLKQIVYGKVSSGWCA